MKEQNAYLAQILGEQALQIDILNGGHTLYGEFNDKDKSPLTNVKFRNGRFISLAVAEEHLAGHFAGPKTLPAYRMLELAAMVGGNVTQVKDAKFNKIVTPGDQLTIFKTPSQSIIARKKDGEMQDVASASMTFNEEGLSPYEMGIVLEIAAQTLVANIVQDQPPSDELLYPLILHVGSIDVVHSDLTNYLNAQPTRFEPLPEQNRFLASAQILSDGNNVVANVEDILFEFASKRRIGMYDAMGRNY